jgi:hypothetical protein
MATKFMLPKVAGRLAGHARRLRAAKILTCHQCAVYETMLWRLRSSGHWAFAADYKSIARLTGVCRDTVIEAVRKLETLTLIKKEKRWKKVFWGRNRANVGAAQIANLYIFQAPITESARPATSKGINKDIKAAEQKIGVNTPKLSPMEAAFARMAGNLGVPLPD